MCGAFIVRQIMSVTIKKNSFFFVLFFKLFGLSSEHHLQRGHGEIYEEAMLQQKLNTNNLNESNYGTEDTYVRLSHCFG